MEKVLIHLGNPAATEALEIALISQGYAVTVAKDAEQRSKFLSTINFDYVIEEKPEDNEKFLFGSLDDIFITDGSSGTSFEKPFTPNNLVNCLNLTVMNNRLRQENSRLRQENSRLREERVTLSPENIITLSPTMRNVYRDILISSSASIPVLVHGEFGTGKATVAEMIHKDSNAQNLFVLRCRDETPESAYRKLTEFRGQNHQESTLILEDIESMNKGLQAEIWRFLKEVKELPHPTNVRVIYTSIYDLSGLKKQKLPAGQAISGQTYSIRVPPLRERRQEIPLWTDYFLRKHGDGIEYEITPDTFYLSLINSDFEYNLDSLEEGIRRAISSAGKRTFLTAGDFKDLNSKDSRNGGFFTLKEMDRMYIQSVLNYTNSNKSKASIILDITRPTLDRRIRDLGIHVEKNRYTRPTPE